LELALPNPDTTAIFYIYEFFDRILIVPLFWMQVPRLHREIHGCEEDLATMTHYRNWYRDRYFKLMSYFQENDTTPALRRESPRMAGFPHSRILPLLHNWRRPNTLF
jgi:hypothetical protein